LKERYHSDEDFKEKCKQKRRDNYNRKKDNEEFKEKCRRATSEIDEK